MNDKGPTMLDVVEQMEKLTPQERVDVILQLTTHTHDQIMRIAEKTLSFKSYRKLKAAVDRERGH